MLDLKRTCVEHTYTCLCIPYADKSARIHRPSQVELSLLHELLEAILQKQTGLRFRAGEVVGMVDVNCPVLGRNGDTISHTREGHGIECFEINNVQ